MTQLLQKLFFLFFFAGVKCDALNFKLSIPRFAMASVSIGNFALFAGGFTIETTEVASDQVDIFDFMTGEHRIEKLSIPRANLAGVAVGPEAYFAGGNNENNNVFQRVDIYNIETRSWRTEELNEARYGLCGVYLSGHALFAGIKKQVQFNFFLIHS